MHEIEVVMRVQYDVVEEHEVRQAVSTDTLTRSAVGNVTSAALNGVIDWACQGELPASGSFAVSAEVTVDGVSTHFDGVKGDASAALYSAVNSAARTVRDQIRDWESKQHPA